MPVPFRMHFRDIEVPTPVIGELGGLIPRVYPSVLISTDVTNDPIEEELRLPVSVYPVPVHFCHHEATKLWLGSISLRRANLCEEMSMELATFFFNLPLEWISFFSTRRDRSLTIGRSRKGY
jgi:hypothetical protein